MYSFIIIYFIGFTFSNVHEFLNCTVLTITTDHNSSNGAAADCFTCLRPLLRRQKPKVWPCLDMEHMALDLVHPTTEAGVRGSVGAGGQPAHRNVDLSSREGVSRLLSCWPVDRAY